jgi:hypothetical protein
MKKQRLNQRQSSMTIGKRFRNKDLALFNGNRIVSATNKAALAQDGFIGS